VDIGAYLASPIGIELQHAVIVFLLAAAGYLSYKSKRQSEKNAELLNSHLEQHVLDVVSKGEPPTTSSGL
jgi:hypothetical protein